tara:strand:+ start:269 stop:1171 length:903 start_codon:yes stop_codon:yes gene_type:complete
MDADYLIDRQRLKKRILLWRTFAIVTLLMFIAALIIKFGSFGSGAYIARIKVENLIHNEPRRLAIIEKVLRDKDAKALIVRINSPGGTVVGGEALYKALSRFRREKPVVAIMDELATSAGYLVAVGANRIIAHEGTITGSIGVIFQTAEITELLKKLGVKFEAIKSTPLKSEPSPFTKFTPKTRKATKRLVDDIYNMFIQIIAKNRNLKLEKVRILADGRLYTGRMAVKNGLVDEIGDELQAKIWLEKEIKIKKSIPIRDITIQRGLKNWLDYASSFLQKSPISERLILDGLVSVWHAQN